MVMSALILRIAAMCFRAWSAYIRPRPGSSEAIRLMAAPGVRENRDPFRGGASGRPAIVTESI